MIIPPYQIDPVETSMLPSILLILKMSCDKRKRAPIIILMNHQTGNAGVIVIREDDFVVLCIPTQVWVYSTQKLPKFHTVMHDYVFMRLVQLGANCAA